MCGWQYREEKGFGPFKPGTEFAALPADFKCVGSLCSFCYVLSPPSLYVPEPQRE